MLTVHHLDHSRSHRILWCLEELGVEYEIERYQRDPKTFLAPPSLKKVHPLGKAPVVTDGSHSLAESGAILEYLVDRYGDGRFRPAEGEDQTPSVDYLAYRFWLHYAEGSLMSPLLLKLVFDRLSSDSPLLIRPAAWALAQGVGRLFIHPNLKTHFDFVESHLKDSPWFAGPEFSAADIQMSFPLEAGESRVGFDRRPAIRDFLKRVRARPPYQRALERGGPVVL